MSGSNSARRHRNAKRAEAMDAIHAVTKRPRSDEQQQQQQQQPGKKQRKNDPVLVPTALTLDAGVRFEHGTVQLSPAVAAASVERLDGATVIDPTHAMTLAPPVQRALAATLAADLETWSPASATPSESLRRIYAPHLLAQAQKHHVRLVHVNAGQIEPAHLPASGALNKRGRLESQRIHEERRRLYYYYNNNHEGDKEDADAGIMGDTEPDPELPFGLPRPGDYPALRALLADIDPIYRQRDTLSEQAARLLPRVSVERVTRNYLEPFLLSHTSESSTRDRLPPCALRGGCICMRLAAEEGMAKRGYIAPRFFRPSELRQWREQQFSGPVVPGLCFLDLLKAWTMRVYHSLMQRHVPAEPINTISVECGPGEFDREVMLPCEVDGYPTGIEGHVPAFNTARLQYQQVKNQSVLRLVHVDFRPSLSQTNVCLGARKLCPLAGTMANTLAVPHELLRCVPPAAVAPQAVWRRFLRSAPVEVLADRALLHHEQTNERVPAVWLRRFFHDEYPSSYPYPYNYPGGGDADADNVPALCFTTYEQTVAMLYEQGPVFCDAMLAYARAVEQDPACADHYHLSTMEVAAADTDNNMLWLALRVRVAAGLVALNAPLPHVPPARRETLGYMARLFVDTHLALLAASTSPSVTPGTSDFWERVLAGAYPHALRVLCADEMPDLTLSMWATNIWYDSGKKSQRGFLYVLVHVLGKLMNQVCQGRSFDTILVGEMQAYPLLANLIALMLACAMLGNVPSSQRPLRCLALRIRVVETFVPGSPLLQAWVYRHPKLAMALLRDYFCHVLERDAAYDELAGSSMNWTRFKAMARELAGQVRDLLLPLMYQCATLDLIWDTLEARCVRWHEYTKAQNVKFKKGNDMDIMLRKMTSMEKKLRFDFPSLYDWMRQDGRLEAVAACAWHAARAMRQPHLDATARTAPRRVLPVGMLKALGMNAGSFRLLRQWLHDYNDYATRDNGYCRVVEAMHREAPRDVLLLKTYLRLVEHYLGDALACCSLEHTREQWRALRIDTGLDPWSKQLELLGRAYFCEGCMRWANHVVLPSRVLLGLDMFEQPRSSTTNTAAAADAPVLLGDHSSSSSLSLSSASSLDDEEEEDDDEDEDAYKAAAPDMPTKNKKEKENHSSNNNTKKKKITIMKKKKKKSKGHEAAAASATSAAPTTMAQPGQGARPPALVLGRTGSVRGARLHPLNGRLYCNRAHLTWPPPDQAVLQQQLIDMGIEKHQRGLDAMAAAKARGDTGVKYNKGLNDIARPLLANFTCQQPLKGIQMVGVYRRVLHTLYGRCVYCGELCAVHAVNMTNDGLSCGRHAEPCGREYGRDHRLWPHLGVPAPPASPSPPPVGRCSATAGTSGQRCAQPGVTALPLYGDDYALRYMSICRWHLHCLRPMLPAAEALQAPPPPLPLKEVVQMLKHK